LNREEAKRLELLEHLLMRGAKLNVADKKGRTALWHAADKGNLAVVQILLAAGADFRVRDTEHGESALERAVRKGHEAMVKLLVEHGASYKPHNKAGKGTIGVATEAGKLEIVKYLAVGIPSIL
jgi:uncharacterized protein